MYAWVREQRKSPQAQQADSGSSAEMSDLKRVTDEPDILKEDRRVLCQAARVKYAFMRDHAHEFRKTIAAASDFTHETNLSP